MTLPVSRAEPEPLILVVDDDRRVRELLEIAFSAHGYRVIAAADGEEAIRRALGEHPDLVVLDVRLPKRSGLEVCEALRNETQDAQVPIILVSAASDNETRLQGFNRGADDFLVKPFSPRELLARVKRLLARTRELRVARDRLGDVEKRLAHLSEESRRAHLEAEHAQHLRDLALGLGADLHRTRDLDALAERLLRAVQAQIDVPAMALLIRDGEGLVPLAVRGDLFDRVAQLGVAAGGELATLLSGLSRPVYRRQLERLPELGPELRSFAAARFDLLLPVRGERGLEALVALEELRAGPPPSRGVLESLGALCGIAAIAVAHAVHDRARAIRAVEVAFGAPDAIAGDTAELLARAARHALLPPRYATMVRLGVRLGRTALDGDGGNTFERVAALDPAGFATGLAGVLRRATAVSGEPAEPGLDGDPDAARAAELIELGWRVVEARAAGLPLSRAVARAHSDRASFALALRRAFDEAMENAPEDCAVATPREGDAAGRAALRNPAAT